MTEANQSVNLQSPSDLPPELDVDQAFQRLLPIIEDPHIARDRLYWGIEHGLVSLNLQDRAGASDSFRPSAEQFSDYYNIVLDKDGDDWHASLRLRAGVFGGYHPEEYKCTIPVAEVEALCRSAAHQGETRGSRKGRKSKAELDVIRALCDISLYDNGVPENITPLVKEMRKEWSNRFPNKKAPEFRTMHGHVSRWAAAYEQTIPTE
jgi:hypothetical protein